MYMCFIFKNDFFIFIFFSILINAEHMLLFNYREEVFTCDSPLRCLPFMWTFLDMMLLSVFHNLSTVDFII